MNVLLEPGTILGHRYTLGTCLASGGMGDVWEATDDILQRPVAVKVLRPADPDDTSFVERFRDEARGSAALHHPNIAAVYDYGEEDDVAYLVMELVPGRTLSDLIRDTHGAGLQPEQIRSIVGQAALALSAAHAAGVVHRDVKPANIIVTPQGQAKLTDFGIARIGDGSGHTRTGEVLGTPDYISPEQALGEPATTASDIYALGVVAHEMVTGRKPFDMGTPVATALAQVHDTPPPLPARAPDDLRRVIAACLAKRPEERPSDAVTIAEAVGVPLGALPGVTPLPSGAGPTTALPPIEPTPDEPAPDERTPTLALPVLGSRRDHRPAAARPQWAWLAVPVVALVVWVAFALGGQLTGSPAATPTSPPSDTATTPAPTQATTTKASTTTTPTSTTTTTTQPPAPAPGNHPGKDKGKGRGKGN